MTRAVLKDSYGRAIRDLRVSLTDRCNFRCFYCLPHGEPPIAPKEQMLSYEEIEYASDIFVGLGIEKIRLTGGEPMMRRDIETIIRKLAALKPALHDLALTTNGYFLPGRGAPPARPHAWARARGRRIITLCRERRRAPTVEGETEK